MEEEEKYLIDWSISEVLQSHFRHFNPVPYLSRTHTTTPSSPSKTKTSSPLSPERTMSWYWYCCHYGDGAHNVSVTPSCPSCITHRRCIFCTLETDTLRSGATTTISAPVQPMQLLADERTTPPTSTPQIGTAVRRFVEPARIRLDLL
ncbi:hypothetical protein IAQ61_007045 [Plenodomus lingam]|uniref:uncharacterized protein n=1 Tax=Leptosphaeria maculans TaxID=5022 RepID=UPI0033166CDF|nr:hypothetical protein IAQ61_007045 [Plenodomus lingam]